MSDMIKYLATPRLLFLQLLLLCITMMLVAVFYFQGYLALEPCPLCIMQRVFVIGTAAVALLAFIHNPGARGRRIYAGAAMLPTLMGVATSMRHVWLQSLPPDKVPECGPGLDYLMEVFSMVEALQQVFKGSGECAEIKWSLLGLTIPGWTLVGLALLLAIEVYQLLRRS